MDIPIELSEVIVKVVPESFGLKQQKAFLCDLARHMDEYRPSIVLDCSKLGTLESPVIYLMLCCLEEALKRNGDVRLAGLSPAAMATLESTGADRLFRIFASNADAIGSFHQRMANAVPYGASRDAMTGASEAAA